MKACLLTAQDCRRYTIESLDDRLLEQIFSRVDSGDSQ